MKTIFYLFFLFAIQLCNASSNDSMYSDSLKIYSNQQLKIAFDKFLNKDRPQALTYAKELLSRSKLSKNNNEIARYYNYIIKSSPSKNRLIYADSLIDFSKGKNLSFYPGIGYYFKALSNYKSKQFSEALDNILIADSLVGNIDSLRTRYWVKQAIGTFKSKIGDHEGALKEYRINLAHFEKNKDTLAYGLNVFSAIESYLVIKQFDSAQYYSNRARKKLRNSNNNITLYLEMSQGFIDYHMENYENAVPILLASIKKMDSLNDFDNVAHCEHYIGLCYQKLNSINKSVLHFERVDSIFQNHKYVNLKLRDSYINLIDHFRKKKNNDKELYYITNLLSLDSVTKSYNSYLKDNIFREYDVPNYLKRKEDLLIQSQSKHKQLSIIISLLVALILVGYVFFLIRKTKEKKKQVKFETVIAELKSNVSKQKTTNSNTSKIPEKDIKTLTTAFKNYDLTQKFTDKNFNKEYIRKDTGINSHYIADYLRDFIGYSLTTYINNKRIELAIDKILNDPIFKKYTMLAMAETIGYSNANTFKRAFLARTGITPLEFISRSNK